MKRLTGILLWAGAFGWGVAVLGVLFPWAWVEPLLLSMGLEHPISSPPVHYWFRMATGGWTVVGFFFLAAAIAPERYRRLIPLLAAGSIFEGVVLLVHALQLDLPLFPCAGDIAFTLAVGIGLLIADPDTRQFFGLVKRPPATGEKRDGS